MRRGLLLIAAVTAAVVCLTGVGSAAARSIRASTDATYFNNAAFAAADPYVMHDPRSGFYYAYSTEGADDGYYFAVYRSADMVTWEKASPGALPVNDPKQWGNTWFWAPETHYNARSHLYFSRNAYRNWVWDSDLGKYIEESNIYAVELTRAWWNDRTGRTMPSIARRYRGANASHGAPAGPRRDGWVRILDYDHDKQAWE